MNIIVFFLNFGVLGLLLEILIWVIFYKFVVLCKGGFIWLKSIN